MTFRWKETVQKAPCVIFMREEREMNSCEHRNETFSVKLDAYSPMDEI